MTTPMNHERCTIHCGDSLQVLKTLPDESVHCCVTSPPYWGLRDYGTAEWEGGLAECDHEPTQEWTDHNFNANSAFGAGAATQSAAAKKRWYAADGACPRCGARRRDDQLGLESTPEEYVANIVEIFGEVKRVLRDDGTLWLNLGDSYASNWPCQRRNVIGAGSLPNGKREARPPRMPEGLKEKDLCGIPWRLALALQADGWYLRADIIWAKPNPMPESVTDRPTKAHEYIFLLTKNKKYYYDNNAIREPHTWEESKPRPSGMERNAQKYRAKVNYGGGGSGFAGHSGSLKADGTSLNHPSGRNKRSVWTITTKPYKEAHFATYNPDLIEPCILAGCPKGGTVLDPFMGSGTTAQVALELGCNALGIELNPDYCELIKKRLNPILEQNLLFT